MTRSHAESSEQKARGNRRKLPGRVVNDTDKPGRAKKTVVVEVERRFRDPVYGKYVKSRAQATTRTTKKNEYRTERPGRDHARAVRSRAPSAGSSTRLIERPEEV